eukprot:1752756-Pyramimonas_sp.AAC.1
MPVVGVEGPWRDVLASSARDDDSHLSEQMRAWKKVMESGPSALGPSKAKKPRPSGYVDGDGYGDGRLDGRRLRRLERRQ